MQKELLAKESVERERNQELESLRRNERDKSVGQLHQVEEAIIILKRELQETKAAQATELRARTHAEKCLNDVQETVSCSNNALNKAQAKNQELLMELQAERSRRTELENAQTEVRELRSNNRQLVSRNEQALTENRHLQSKVQKIKVAHEDLRGLYSEHLTVLKSRKTSLFGSGTRTMSTTCGSASRTAMSCTG